MAVMWAYMINDGAVAKAAALFVGLMFQFGTSSLNIIFGISKEKSFGE